MTREVFWEAPIGNGLYMIQYEDGGYEQWNGDVLVYSEAGEPDYDPEPEIVADPNFEAEVPEQMGPAEPAPVEVIDPWEWSAPDIDLGVVGYLNPDFDLLLT